VREDRRGGSQGEGARSKKKRGSTCLGKPGLGKAIAGRPWEEGKQRKGNEGAKTGAASIASCINRRGGIFSRE